MATQTTNRQPTARQIQVYEFLCSFLREHGYPPSVRDICRFFGWTALNGAFGHLRALKRCGLIRLEPGISRGITVVARHGEPCPCCGQRVAPEPSEIDEDEP